MCGAIDSFCTRCAGRGWTWDGRRRVPCRSCDGTGLYVPHRDRRWQW